MRHTTQIFVAVIGVAMVGIALAHLVLGGAAVIGGSPLNATAQGEHRFFAALLLCCGIAFLWCVPKIETKRRLLNLLAGAVLLGGLARMLSIAIDGPPNTFYSVMLLIELTMPLLLFVLIARLPQSL